MKSISPLSHTTVLL